MRGSLEQVVSIVFLIPFLISSFLAYRIKHNPNIQENMGTEVQTKSTIWKVIDGIFIFFFLGFFIINIVIFIIYKFNITLF